jgi:hypothetical protein
MKCVILAVSSGALMLITSCKNKISNIDIENALQEIASKTSCREWLSGCVWRDRDWVHRKSISIGEKLNGDEIIRGSEGQMVWAIPEGYFEVMFWKENTRFTRHVQIYSQASNKIRNCKLLSDSFVDSMRNLSKIPFDSSYSEAIGILIDRDEIKKIYSVNPIAGDYMNKNMVCY